MKRIFFFLITCFFLLNSYSFAAPPNLINIISPQDGDYLSQAVIIEAELTKIPKVRSVKFYVDNEFVREDTASPYQYEWDTTTYSDGQHQIYASILQGPKRHGPPNPKAKPPVLSPTVTVIVDNSPPAIPSVIDAGDSTFSQNELHAIWLSSDPESGIVEYKYAIGTTEGGTDVVGWTSVGTSTETTETNLILTASQTYYFSVEAINGVGLSSIGFSDGITVIVDATLPITPIVIDGGKYAFSTTTLHAYWISQDPESEIIENQYSIGTTPGETDIVSWTSVGTDIEVAHTGLTLTHGQTYYFNVKTQNYAGLWSDIGSSDGIIVNAHIPAINNVTPLNDSTFFTKTQVNVTIDAQDKDGDPLEYRFLVDDKIEQDWSASSTYEWTALPTTTLIRKITCQVRDDKEAQASQNVHYNIEIDTNDTTPPSTPIVTTDEYSNSLTSLHASWYSEDPESGIAEFQYAIGTFPGGTDVVDWTSVGTNQEVTHYDLELIKEQDYYFTVKATNGVELESSEGNSSANKASEEVTIRITSPSNNSLITDNEFPLTGIATNTSSVSINGKTTPVSGDTFNATLIAPGKAHREGEGSNHIVMNFPGPTEITISAKGQSDKVTIYYYQVFVKGGKSSKELWGLVWPVVTYRIRKYQYWNNDALTQSPFDSDSWKSPDCNQRSYSYYEYEGWDGEWEYCEQPLSNIKWYMEEFLKRTGPGIIYEVKRDRTSHMTIHTLPVINGKKQPMVLVFYNCWFRYNIVYTLPLPGFSLSLYTVNGKPLQRLYGDVDIFPNAYYVILTDYQPDTDMELQIDIPTYDWPGEYTIYYRCFGFGDIDVLRVEMTAYRPQTQPFDWWTYAVPDSDEMSPGVGIRINGDDDNHNGIADKDEEYGIITGEDDLIKVILDVGAPTLSGIKYVLKRSNSNIKVWENPTKGTAILGTDDEQVLTFDESTKTIWVEYSSTHSGTADLELQAQTEDDIVVWFDRIKFYSFESVVVGLGGENQIPTDPPDNNHGTFRIAKDLYLDGYDVHMFDEDKVGFDGSGAAYNEVESAVADRGVTQVAIFGYSHGGGSTHDLAERLNNNKGTIGTFSVSYTGYIDAVKNSSAVDMRAENRKPPGTAYLVNYYQEGTWGEDKWLDGGPVPGADYEINVDDPIPTETHFTIDDEPVVLNGIRSRLTQRVAK